MVRRNINAAHLFFTRITLRRMKVIHQQYFFKENEPTVQTSALSHIASVLYVQWKTPICITKAISTDQITSHQANNDAHFQGFF